MPGKNGGNFFSDCSFRLFHGQTRKNLFKSFHYDCRKFYIKSKKASITKRLRKKSYLVLCINKLARRFLIFLDKIENLRIEDRRWASLLRLFVKYLNFRCPYLDSSVIENLGYLVVALIAVSTTEKIDNFDPGNLWDLVASKYLLNAPHVFIEAMAEVVGQDLWNETGFFPKFMGVSLFGEFLFYCSLIDRGINSPMDMIRSNAPIEEALLVDDISMAITPELGILTFILYRNLANTINCKIQTRSREFYIFMNRDYAYRIYPSVSTEFCQLRKIIQGIPKLEYLFRKFLSYLGSEVSQCFYYYGKAVLNMDILIYLHNDIYVPFPYNRMADLVYIMKYILDILLFLYNKDEEHPTKQIIYISEYLTDLLPQDEGDVHNSFIYRTTEGYQSASALLIALSLFLDFLFVENWKSEESSPFMFLKAWNEVNKDLKNRCKSIKDYVEDYKLFPFFRYIEDGNFMELLVAYLENLDVKMN